MPSRTGRGHHPATMMTATNTTNTPIRALVLFALAISVAMTFLYTAQTRVMRGPAPDGSKNKRAAATPFPFAPKDNTGQDNIFGFDPADNLNNEENDAGRVVAAGVRESPSIRRKRRYSDEEFIRHEQKRRQQQLDEQAAHEREKHAKDHHNDFANDGPADDETTTAAMGQQPTVAVVEHLASSSPSPSGSPRPQSDQNKHTKKTAVVLSAEAQANENLFEWLRTDDVLSCPNTHRAVLAGAGAGTVGADGYNHDGDGDAPNVKLHRLQGCAIDDDADGQDKKKNENKKKKFLYYGAQWGRHFNQLTSLMAALTLARSLDRTLIIPPFTMPDKAKVAVDDLYDLSALFSSSSSSSADGKEEHHGRTDRRSSGRARPFCFVLESEFLEIEKKRWEKQHQRQQQEEADQGGKKWDGKIVADCATMRGIKPHPQLPQKPGTGFTCEHTHYIDRKKNPALLFHIVGGRESDGTATTATTKDHHETDAGNVLSARVLTLPLVIYYAAALPEDVTRCAWSLIRPHPIVARAVSLFFRDSVTSSDADTPVAAHHHDHHGGSRTVGIHIRALEGSCKGRAKEFRAASTGAGAGAGGNRALLFDVVLQCDITAKYVGDVLAATTTSNDNSGSSGGSTEHYHQQAVVTTFVIADDGQQPERVKALRTQLPLLGTMGSTTSVKHRVVQVGDLLSSSPSAGASSFAAYVAFLKTIRKVNVASGDNKRADNSNAVMVNNIFAVYPSMLLLQVDFWAMTQTTEFVGNQISTVSQCVCRRRLASGLRCTNFANFF